MAEVSYPSPAHNSRNVTDAEYEKIAARFSDDGVYGSPFGNDVVVPGTGLQVLVKADTEASLRGHAWVAGSTDVPLAITANASGSTRYDWVVLRLDRSTWTVRAAVVEGTPGSGLPSITTDTGETGFYDLPLAYVTVPSGASTVTVTQYTLFVGTRIRARESHSKTGFRNPGELYFVTDTGTWEGYDGAQAHTIFSDTGLLDIQPGFSTWEKAFACVGRRVGEVVTLRLWYRRVGSTFGASDPDGSKLGVLPAPLISTYNNFFPARFGSGQACTIDIRNNTGEIWATDLSSDVEPGRTLHLTCTYIRETD